MCGLVGVVAEDDRASITRLKPGVERGMDALRSRGPDDAALWSDDRWVVLGHRRLAVLDLTIEGRQPKASSDGRYVIAYNGEIYNFLDVRAELEAEGVTFRSRSDTEVLLEGVRVWGVQKLLPRLNGMFAFALWDCFERELWLVRDRFGVKPLVYTQQAGVLAFGSTVSALAGIEGVCQEIEPRAIGHYVQSLCVPGSTAIYRDHIKVPPATWMRFRPGRTEVETGRFWEPGTGAELAVGEAEYLEELDRLLDEATRRRLVSDVPVGLFLSGGIDSSLVASYAAEAQPGLQSFTISFDEKEYDESTIAAAVARATGTTHRVLPLTADDVLAELPNVASAFDEPFADVSAVPTLALSRATRECVTVALSGDGGDELFAGYNYHRWCARMAPVFRFAPLALRRPLGWVGRSRVPYRARLLATALSLPTLAEAYAYMRGPLKDVSAAGMLLGEAREVDPGAAYLDAVGATTDPDRFCLLDFQHYMVDDILVKVDRASMAHSLEVRSPFLDVELVDFIQRVPFEWRLRGGVGKYLSRRLLARRVPAASVAEQPKRGFRVPIRTWLATDLADEVREIGSYDWAPLSLDPDAVRRVLGEHLRGERVHDSLLWTLWVLMRWNEARKSACLAA